MSNLTDQIRSKIRKLKARDASTQQMGYVYATTDQTVFKDYTEAFKHQTKIYERGENNMVTATAQPNVIKVKAMSNEHAKKLAAALSGYPVHMIQSVAEIKKPREAKTCTTDDFPVKGTRKWVTVYNVYTYGTKIPLGRNRYQYSDMEFVKGGFDQKTDAVKVAREMAVKHQLPMTVQIAKELESDSPHVTDVEPKTTFGEFTVTFRV